MRMLGLRVLWAILAAISLWGCVEPVPRIDDGVALAPRLAAGKTAAVKEAGPQVPLSPVDSRSLGKETENIDLATALRLAGAQNLDVQILEERLKAASADVDAATALFLPGLSIGASYSRHDGRFQETRGDVFDVSRSSLSAGPTIHLGIDPGAAHFERLRAKQILEAVQQGGARTRAEAMVRSAILYLDLLRARAIVEVAREAVEHSRAQVELSRGAVAVRAELRVNLARATAELARDQHRLAAAENDFQRASVELAVWLRLPPKTTLIPQEDRIQTVSLIDPDTSLDDLLATAEATRPDLKELEALRRAAEERREGARWSPWLPEVDVFGHYGAFGGGRSSFFGDFGDRGDFGGGLTWTFSGFGFGDAARYRRAQAEARQAALQLKGLEEVIAGQVIRTREEIRSLRTRIEAARARVEASTEALALVQARFQAGDAIQLEVLAAITEIADSRAELVRAIIAYNQAQHLLHYQVYGAARSTER